MQPASHSNTVQSAPYLQPRNARERLLLIIRSRSEPDEFTAAQLDRLRHFVACNLPFDLGPRLSTFVERLLATPEVAAAYFRPTVVGDDAGGSRSRLVLPYDLAIAAAQKACKMDCLLPQERLAAWAAAFASPCGFFVARDVVSSRPSEMVEPALKRDHEQLRALLLEEPLRELRRASAPMANTLAAVFSGSADEDCGRDQVARISTAVQLSLVGLEQLWGKCQ